MFVLVESKTPLARAQSMRAAGLASLGSAMTHGQLLTHTTSPNRCRTSSDAAAISGSTTANLRVQWTTLSLLSKKKKRKKEKKEKKKPHRKREKVQARRSNRRPFPEGPLGTKS